METFLAIQNTYDQVQMAIGDDRANLGQIICLDKTVASKECMSTLDQLLRQNSVSLSSLSFIAVNQGPGPFTTLRVVISTVNGLSFSTGIPLVGINGMQALSCEYPSHSQKVIFLNAFAGDVYYLVDAHGIRMSGATSITIILQELLQKIPHNPILFLGNGTLLYQDMIVATFGDRAQFPDPFVSTCSLATIAKQGLAQWHAKKNVSYQLQPLYYKSAFAKPLDKARE